MQQFSKFSQATKQPVFLKKNNNIIIQSAIYSVIL